MTFYITRHGETEWNIKGLMQGHEDSPLTPLGKGQARQLSDKLRGIHFDEIFSSDLIRAIKTAEVIALERNLAVKATRALRERNMGIFEGTKSDEFWSLFNEWQKLSEEERKKHKRSGDFETVEESESMTTRLINFLRETAIAFRGKSILIMTHGGIMSHFLTHLGYGENKRLWIENGALAKIESDGIEFDIKEIEGVKIAQ